MTIRCPACNVTNLDGARTCVRCLAPLGADDPDATSPSGGANPTQTENNPPGAARQAGGLAGLVLGGVRLGDKLGGGAMGTVYRGYQQNVGNRVVAVKVINESIVADLTQVTRFQQEAEVAGNLDSPYIIKVINSGNDQGYYYIVMEYVEDGLTLGKYAKSLPLQRIPIDECVRYLRQCCEALLTAERAPMQIVHRDIKPENILLARRKNDAEQRLDVRVADFGAAKVENVELTKSSAAPMTPRYASPEQWGFRIEGVRTDIYCLGASFYHLLTGVAATRGSNEEIAMWVRKQPYLSPRREMPEMPEDLSRIIEKMTAQRAADRFQSFEHVIHAVDAFLEGRPGAFKAPPKVVVVQGGFPIWIVTSLVAALALVIGGVVWKQVQERAEIAAAKQELGKEMTEARGAQARLSSVQGALGTLVANANLFCIEVKEPIETAKSRIIGALATITRITTASMDTASIEDVKQRIADLREARLTAEPNVKSWSERIEKAKAYQTRLQAIKLDQPGDPLLDRARACRKALTDLANCGEPDQVAAVSASLATQYSQKKQGAEEGLRDVEATYGTKSPLMMQGLLLAQWTGDVSSGIGPWVELAERPDPWPKPTAPPTLILTQEMKDSGWDQEEFDVLLRTVSQWPAFGAAEQIFLNQIAGRAAQMRNVHLERGPKDTIWLLAYHKDDLPATNEQDPALREMVLVSGFDKRPLFVDRYLATWGRIEKARLAAPSDWRRQDSTDPSKDDVALVRRVDAARKFAATVGKTLLLRQDIQQAIDSLGLAPNDLKEWSRANRQKAPVRKALQVRSSPIQWLGELYEVSLDEDSSLRVGGCSIWNPEAMNTVPASQVEKQAVRGGYEFGNVWYDPRQVALIPDMKVGFRCAFELIP